MSTNCKFINFLKQAESETYMSRAQIAQRAGLSQEALTRWIRERRAPSLRNYEAALNALGYELTMRKRT